MIRRTVAIALIALTALVSSPATLGLVDAASADAIEMAGTVPDDAGHSIGSPDAGPRPQQSGDRGGWAQLSILGLLVVAVSFIMWRIFHDARGGQKGTY